MRRIRVLLQLQKCRSLPVVLVYLTASEKLHSRLHSIHSDYTHYGNTHWQILKKSKPGDCLQIAKKKWFCLCRNLVMTFHLIWNVIQKHVNFLAIKASSWTRDNIFTSVLSPLSSEVLVSENKLIDSNMKWIAELISKKWNCLNVSKKACIFRQGSIP